MCNKAMKEMFKQINTTMTKVLKSKIKPETYDRNWGQMINEKKSKLLPPIRIPKLSKKSKDKENENLKAL